MISIFSVGGGFHCVMVVVYILLVDEYIEGLLWFQSLQRDCFVLYNHAI
jgi:hypothetical protein